MAIETITKINARKQIPIKEMITEVLNNVIAEFVLSGNRGDLDAEKTNQNPIMGNDKSIKEIILNILNEIKTPDRFPKVKRIIPTRNSADEPCLCSNWVNLAWFCSVATGFDWYWP